MTPDWRGTNLAPGELFEGLGLARKEKWSTRHVRINAGCPAMIAPTEGVGKSALRSDVRRSSGDVIRGVRPRSHFQRASDRGPAIFFTAASMPSFAASTGSM